jgi:phosphatase NudJ
MPVPRKPSVTVAAIVARDGRFLLVEEQTPEGIRLNQPAGHLDPGESLVDAVVREALEETTRTFTPDALLGVYLARSASAHEAGLVTYVRFAFTGTVGEPNRALALDHGILRTLWLTADEVRARAGVHRSPLVMKCIEDHLAGQRYPLSVLHTHPSAVT